MAHIVMVRHMWAPGRSHSSGTCASVEQVHKRVFFVIPTINNGTIGISIVLTFYERVFIPTMISFIIIIDSLLILYERVFVIPTIVNDTVTNNVLLVSYERVFVIPTIINAAKIFIGNQANIMHFRGFDINHDLNDSVNAGDLEKFSDGIKSAFFSRQSDYIQNLLSADNVENENVRNKLSHLVRLYFFIINL